MEPLPIITLIIVVVLLSASALMQLWGNKVNKADGGAPTKQ